MSTKSLPDSTLESTSRLHRGLALYERYGHLIEEVAPDFYLVPSQDGEHFYHVDYREETCDCPNHYYREATCLHIYAVGISLAKRRSFSCDGCGRRYPNTERVEVGEDSLTFFDGDELCLGCALGHGEA